jgi:hypothetical protein
MDSGNKIVRDMLRRDRVLWSLSSRMPRLSFLRYDDAGDALPLDLVILGAHVFRLGISEVTRRQ